MPKNYELAIVRGDSPYVTGLLQNYTRFHDTYEDAEAEAYRILSKIDDGTRAAHPAIIYGPDCGPNGRTVTL